MRMDEPQEGIVPGLRRLFDAVPYRPGLSDAETALRLLDSGVRNTGQIVEVLQRVGERFEERTTISALRAKADILACAMTDAFADQARGLFGARATEEMRTLVNGVIDTLSGGFSSVDTGLSRIANEVTGVRDELVMSREVLAKILSGTQDTIEEMRRDALDTRSALVDRLDDVVDTAQRVGDTTNEYLRRIYEAGTKPRATASDEIMGDGAAFMLQEEPDYGSAVNEFNSALNIRPRNAEARYLLGRCHIELGDATRAKAALHRAIQNQDDPRLKAEYRREAARLHIALHEYQRAADVLKEAARAQPHDSETLFQYAIALITIGDVDSALDNLQCAVRADPLYDLRVGLVPELATIYRNRLKLLHEPIAYGETPAAYEAALTYGALAIELGQDNLAFAYLTRHASAHSTNEHVKHFEHLLALPPHRATTARLRATLAAPLLEVALPLTTLLNSARELLERHAVNPADTICRYQPDKLLGMWQQLMALPDTIRIRAFERIAHGYSFGRIPLLPALKSVAEVQRLGEAYASIASKLLARHLDSFSPEVTWVVLEDLVETGCREEVRAAVSRMLDHENWVFAWFDSYRPRLVAHESGLPEFRIRAAFTFDAQPVERRLAAVVGLDPTLGGKIAVRLVKSFKLASVLDAIGPASSCWAEQGFRRTVFSNSSVASGFDDILQLFLRLPDALLSDAMSDFAAVARLEKHPVPSTRTVMLLTELFSKPILQRVRDEFFEWLQQLLARHITDALAAGKLQECRLRPAALTARWSVTPTLLRRFFEIAQRASHRENGSLRSLELDVAVWQAFGDSASSREIIRAVSGLSFREHRGEWDHLARCVVALIGAKRGALAEDAIAAAMRQIGRADPPKLKSLQLFPRTEATLRLCLLAISNKNAIASWNLDEVLPTLIGSGTIRHSDVPVVRWAVRRRKFWSIFDN